MATLEALFRATTPPPARPQVEPDILSIYVMATTEGATRAALEAAGGFARDLHAQIVLLVPHVVPYAQSLDHPADSAEFAGETAVRSPSSWGSM